MSIDEIIDFLNDLDGVATMQPRVGDGSPEISWGDVFFFYAPEGDVPARTQPFATIVTKDYPGDEDARLDRPGAFRLSVFAGRDIVAEWIGHEPATESDPSASDVLMAHPVYGTQGWLAVVNPGPRTEDAGRQLLRTAHERARDRYLRRATPANEPARLT